MIKDFLSRLRSPQNRSVYNEVFDQYELKTPNHQNAINAVEGWSSAFPVPDLRAGPHALYADRRITEAVKTYGSLANKTVLEVGPLDGMHTYILSRENPARIDAIEANRRAFLRCLITKEILELSCAHFLLGDIQQWLEAGQNVYDFAVVSGVLYHLRDPAAFLVQLSHRANAIFIWTHFFDEAAMPNGDPRRGPFTGHIQTKTIEGLPAVRYFERSYQLAERDVSFCGGMRDKHYWMNRNDILLFLRAIGYKTILIQSENLAHSGGPSISIFCRK